MNDNKLVNSYMFSLRLYCGGFAYYSTLSHYVKIGHHGREFRAPSSAPWHGRAPLVLLLKDLGHPVERIENKMEYQRWIHRTGWAIVPVDVARDIMEPWLKQHECTKTHTNSYIDVSICSDTLLAGSANRIQKEIVGSRDGTRCLGCNNEFSDTNPRTMQHIRPTSRGGENTTFNQAALCEGCNQAFGAEDTTFLYDRIGLTRGIDLSLIRKGEITLEKFWKLFNICDNLMYSRCKIF